MTTFAFTSCTNEAKDFTGNWKIYGFTINDIPQELVISEISFEKQSDINYSVNGNSGVNAFFGEVTIKGSKICSKPNFGSTKMAGSPAEMEFEDNFLKCLLGASNARITTKNGADILTITNTNDNSVLSFIRNSSLKLKK